MSNGAIPGASPSPAAGHTEPTGAAAPQGGDPAGTTSGSDAGSPSHDYLGRIRSGGEFAASEVTKAQSRATKAEQRVQKLGALADWAEQVGPETLQKAVERYATLRQEPKWGKLIERFEATGTVPDPGGYDGYSTPEYAEPDDPRDIKIRQLEERVVAQETTGGTQALMGHVEKFFSEFPLPREVSERAREKAISTVRQWSQLGPVGTKSIQNLQTANGYDTVKGLLLSQLSRAEILEAGRIAHLRDRGQVDRYATDVPSGLSTTGREFPPELKNVEQALRYAKEHPDRI